MLKEKEREKGKTTHEVSPWRPLTDLSRMEREMGRLFEGFFGGPRMGLRWPERLRFWEKGFYGPAVEIYEEKDDVVVKAELPGMKKEDLEVMVSDNVLTIKGEKKGEEEIKEKGFHYSERSFGSFERCIELPREIQNEKAHATFKEGVLELRFPKTEEAKRKEKKIRID